MSLGALEVIEDENVGTILVVERVQRARVSYACTDCGHDIDVASLYRYRWSMCDGSSVYERSHIVCYDD